MTKTKTTPPANTKQTFQERINDTRKSSLSDKFIASIRAIAEDNGKSEDFIWEKWVEYSDYCSKADQSALLQEFCLWNKLTFPG